MVLRGIIKITTEKPFYLPGQIITANVHLTLEKEIKGGEGGVKMMIRWKGYERTLVYDEIVAQSHRQNVVISRSNDTKELFNTVVLVNNFGDTVAPGVHDFAVTFELPKDIPSSSYYSNEKSFSKVKKGIVLYKVKCWVDEGGTQTNHPEAKLGLIRRVDRIIVADIPPINAIHKSNEKSFLLSKGKLHLTVDMEKNYYAPGEIIPVKVHVENETSKKVDALKVKLMQKIIVRAEGKSREYTNEVLKKEFPGVDEKSKKDITLDVKLEQTTCPCTKGKLMEVSYEMTVECDVPMAPDLNAHFDIVIVPTPHAGQPLFLYNKYEPKKWIPVEKRITG